MQLPLLDNARFVDSAFFYISFVSLFTALELYILVSVSETDVMSRQLESSLHSRMAELQTQVKDRRHHSIVRWVSGLQPTMRITGLSKIVMAAKSIVMKQS